MHGQNHIKNVKVSPATLSPDVEWDRTSKGGQGMVEITIVS